MAAARTALPALLLALRAAAGSALLQGASALPGLDELEESPAEELLAMESSWTVTPFYQARPGPGLDELEDALAEELLAMETFRSWTAAPFHQVRKGGVIGVVQRINTTSSGATALDGCGACRAVQGASALPGLDELEEPLDEELLALESLRSWTAAPSHFLLRARQ